MGVNKNFIVKNGLQVADQLIFTDVAKNSVGIGTSIINYRFHVIGGIGASTLTVTGVSTFAALSITYANLGVTTAPSYYVTTNKVLSVESSQVTLSGIQTIDATTKAAFERELAISPNDFSDINVTGISTFTNGPILVGSGSSTGIASQTLQVTGGAYVSNNLGIGSVNPTSKLSVVGNSTFTGILTATTVSSTNFNSTYGNFTGIATASTLNATTGNIVSGVVTTLTGTGLTYTSSNFTTLNATTGNIVSGVVTTLTGTNLSYSGISTISGVNISSGIITATTSGIVTYYGDGGKLTGIVGGISGINTAGGVVGTGVTILELRGSGISTVTVTAGIATVNIIGGVPGGSNTQIQYNNSGAFGGSSNLTFNGTTVSVGGTYISINSTGIRVSSGIVTATDFNSTSDNNLKENVQTFDNALSVVSELRGVRFDWKKDHKPSIGVIAQELEEVLPELVSDTDPKTVNYNGIIGVLIEAVKELSAEVETLKKQINNQ